MTTRNSKNANSLPARVPAPAAADFIALKLTPQEFGVIQHAINMMPFHVAAPVVMSLERQLAEQRSSNGLSTD
ncbi:hypothetical protein [Burkholderia gladioli]|uniref:hypothetical protein n=1 Tax=Burkholderia gladioli TaxID=28095 RepID=UPI001640B726|nr:hypothetical protein [Burkholderia gladioli]